MGLETVGITAEAQNANRLNRRSRRHAAANRSGLSLITRPVPPHLTSVCAADSDTDVANAQATHPAFVVWSPSAQQCNACRNCTVPPAQTEQLQQTQQMHHRVDVATQNCVTQRRQHLRRQERRNRFKDGNNAVRAVQAQAVQGSTTPATNVLATVGVVDTNPNCGRCDPFKAPNINVIQVPKLALSCDAYVRCTGGRSPPSCDDANIAALCALERLGTCPPPKPVGYNSAINSGVFAVVGGSY